MRGRHVVVDRGATPTPARSPTYPPETSKHRDARLRELLLKGVPAGSPREIEEMVTMVPLRRLQRGNDRDPLAGVRGA